MNTQDELKLSEVQKQLAAFWKESCSEEKQKEMITIERRWSFWLSVKRDCLMEAGFTREETAALLCSYLGKTEPFMNLNVRGVGFVGDRGGE